MINQIIQRFPLTLIPQVEGCNLNSISLETAPDGRIVKANIETYAGVLEIGAHSSIPGTARLTLNFIPAPKLEEISDSERLEALLMNPDRFWTRNADGGQQFCGDMCYWRNNRHEALDDLVRSLRVPKEDQAESSDSKAKVGHLTAMGAEQEYSKGESPVGASTFANRGDENPKAATQ